MVQNIDGENVRPVDRWLDGYGFTLADLSRFARESRNNVILSIAAMTLLALLYVLLSPAKYTATSRVLIEARSVENFMSKDGFGGDIDAGMMQSQIERLRSNGVLKLVLEEIGYGTIAPGIAEDDSLSEDEKFERAVPVLAGGIAIQRAGISHVIEISFSWTDPETSAEIANAFADAFITEEFNARADSVNMGREWLEGRIEELQEKFHRAAVEVQAFKAKRDYRILAEDTSDENTEAEKSKRVDNPKQTLIELESLTETYEKTYESHLQAYNDSIQRQLYPETNMRIIGKALTPRTKSSPKMVRPLGGAIFFGGFIGLGITLVRYAFRP